MVNQKGFVNKKYRFIGGSLKNHTNLMQNGLEEIYKHDILVKKG